VEETKAEHLLLLFCSFLGRNKMHLVQEMN